MTLLLLEYHIVDLISLFPLLFFLSFLLSFFPRYRADFALVRTVGAEGEELWATCLVEVNDGYVNRLFTCVNRLFRTVDDLFSGKATRV